MRIGIVLIGNPDQFGQALNLSLLFLCDLLQPLNLVLLPGEKLRLGSDFLQDLAVIVLKCLVLGFEQGEGGGLLGQAGG